MSTHFERKFLYRRTRPGSSSCTCRRRKRHRCMEGCKQTVSRRCYTASPSSLFSRCSCPRSYSQRAKESVKDSSRTIDDYLMISTQFGLCPGSSTLGCLRSHCSWRTDHRKSRTRCCLALQCYKWYTRFLPCAQCRTLSLQCRSACSKNCTLCK